MKKKVLALFLAALCVFSLVACDSKKNETTSSSETSTANKEIEPADYWQFVKDCAAVYEKYITLPTYTGIEVSGVDKSSYAVADSDVESYLTYFQKQYSTTETLTSGTTVTGDVITLDYSGKLDGVAFSGGTATDASYTVGSGRFITDLDEGLVGKEVGVTYDIPCTFPSDYSTESLAGKEVIFTVTISAISRTVIPELTDELVAEHAADYDYTAKTVEEFKTEIRQYLEESEESDYKSEIASLVLDKINENITLDSYPEAEYKALRETIESNLQLEYSSYSSSYTLDEYISLAYGSGYGLTDKTSYDAYADEYCKSWLKDKMVITLIAVKENREVTADAINQMGADYADYYGYDSYSTILDEYGKEMNCEIGYQVMYNDIIEFLADKAVIQ